MNNLFALRNLVWALVATSLMMPTRATGDPTDLDASFGAGGIARLPTSVWLVDATTYPDGRAALLIAEHAAPYTRSVVRLDAFGLIDASFKRVLALPGFTIDSIAVTSAGRLVTLQNLLDLNGETRVTRHLNDGSLDPAFGESGNALVSRFAYSQFSARLPPSGEFTSGLVVDPSGRLYMSTELSRAGIVATWITRVEETGSPVAQLNRSNAAPPPLRYGPIRANADGTVVALLHGYRQSLFGGPEVGGPAMIRLVGGVPDPTFGSAGIAFHPMPDWWSTYPGHGVFDLAFTPDGGYVIVGLVQQPQYLYQIVVVKFTATGQIDRAFGAGGVAPLKLAQPGDLPPSAANLAVQSDGRIVVASTLVDVVEGSFVSLRVGLGRLTATGQPDPKFAAAGVKSFWVERGTSAKFVSVRPDGRIVVVGELYPPPVGGVYQQYAVFQFLGGDSTRTRPLGERLAIEYLHVGYGHYFLTADPHEIMNLDAYNPNGWARTGYSFRVWNDDDPSLRPACRFWSDQSFAPKSSHFYTPYEAECATLKGDDTWGFERNAFDLRMPEGTPGSRVCPIESRPLYRVYNNGLGGAPNHRYTIERRVLDEMVSKGWTMEGEAQTEVFACVPPE